MQPKVHLHQQDIMLTTVEEQGIQQQLHRLERKLARYAQAMTDITVAPDSIGDRVQVALCVRLQPSGPPLVSLQEANMADDAMEFAVDDVTRQLFERHSTRHHSRPSYGIPGHSLVAASPRQGGSPIL
jgi:hypothetical protein